MQLDGSTGFTNVFRRGVCVLSLEQQCLAKSLTLEPIVKILPSLLRIAVIPPESRLSHPGAAFYSGRLRFGSGLVVAVIVPKLATEKRMSRHSRIQAIT